MYKELYNSAIYIDDDTRCPFIHLPLNVSAATTTDATSRHYLIYFNKIKIIVRVVYMPFYY